MEHIEKVRWYSKNWKNIYNFEPCSLWRFKRRTPFDMSIEDPVWRKTYKAEQEIKIKKGNMKWGQKIALSKFNSEYAKNIISYYTCEGDFILDPFAGRTRGIISWALNRNYIGFEINKKYIFDNRIINDDCINIDKHLDIEFRADVLFTCPPYWNLEVYSENILGDLSLCKTYADFKNEYNNRLVKALSFLKNDGVAIIVVTDFRRNGQVMPLHYDTFYIMANLGWQIHDTIILEMNPNARRIYYCQAITCRYMQLSHEYALIFRKGKIDNLREKKFTEDYQKIESMN